MNHLIIYVIMLSKTTLIISVVSIPIKISISVISYRVRYKEKVLWSYGSSSAGCSISKVGLITPFPIMSFPSHDPRSNLVLLRSFSIPSKDLMGYRASK